MSNMTIYEGEFFRGKTTPMGMLLYPSGDIYFGQQSQFMKHGYGKLIKLCGSFSEGTWEEDKLSGKCCRIYEEATGNIYVGPIEENKKRGWGRLYDGTLDEVYEGEFENNKKSGEGRIIKRNGQVLKGSFHNNFLDGNITKEQISSKRQIDVIFENAKGQNNHYLAVNKDNNKKVAQLLKRKYFEFNNPYLQLSEEIPTYSMISKQ